VIDCPSLKRQPVQTTTGESSSSLGKKIRMRHLPPPGVGWT
jgi:hypothetical protein